MADLVNDDCLVSACVVLVEPAPYEGLHGGEAVSVVLGCARRRWWQTCPYLVRRNGDIGSPRSNVLATLLDLDRLLTSKD